jgi:hypothetical protein
VLVELLNQRVKAPDLEALKKARNRVLSRLCLDDRKYLRTYYQLPGSASSTSASSSFSKSPSCNDVA